MKTVILAGGYGTRISEESGVRPKPMVEIGGKPILWHVMKIYSSYGIKEFIICCGYKGHLIKEYFSNYFLHQSDVTFDMINNEMEVHKKKSEKWKITLIDTGDNSMTGGRIKRIKEYTDGEAFCLTYGDGVSNVNINHLIKHHNDLKSLATVTAVQQHGRFGVFTLEPGKSTILNFREKQKGDAWINGGFFVVEPEIFDYIDGDSTIFEMEPLEKLSKEGKLSAYRHTDFWQPMDTLRDKYILENLWNSGRAPWKIWD